MCCYCGVIERGCMCICAISMGHLIGEYSETVVLCFKIRLGLVHVLQICFG